MADLNFSTISVDLRDMVKSTPKIMLLHKPSFSAVLSSVYSSAIKFIVVLCALFAISVPAVASSDCISDQELLNMRIDSEIFPTPCTEAGLMYLYGVAGGEPGARIEGYQQTTRADYSGSFPIYYGTIRRYFSAKPSYPELHTDYDLISLLMKALVELPDKTDDRNPIYSGFVAIEFSNLPEIDIYKFGDGWINFLSDKISETGFRNEKEFLCFVFVDIPGFEIETIVNSVAFNSCIESL